MARPASHLDLALDEVLLAHLPAGGTVVKVHQLGLGEWCDTTKYDVKLPNETVARFFEKVDSGASPLDQTGGRFIEPTLCHTDLWPGNVKYRLDGKSPLVFDANALWGHSEMELGLFRNPRYPLEMPFLEGYLRKVPVAEPAEDFECRNIVHMLRYQICLASVYPDEADLRKVFLSNMRFLVDMVNSEEAERQAMENSKPPSIEKSTTKNLQPSG